MMNIYHYDKIGVYQGTTVARQDPLEPGRYLVPRNATTVAPPAEESGKARVFNGTAWVQREDHRGKLAYNEDNRSGVIIAELGPVPNRFTLNAPTSEFDRLINGE